MELTEKEKILIDILRHFDFLRKYNFKITDLSFSGRAYYVIYSTFRKEIYIEFSIGYLKVEYRKNGLIRAQCYDISKVAKQHKVFFDTLIDSERIEKYADFIKTHGDLLK